MLDYLKYAISEAERVAVTAVSEHGSNRKAARALGKSKTAIQEAVKRVKDRAALQGYSPEHDMTHTAPDTHIVKGTSTLYKDGEPVLQWVKTHKKYDDFLSAMRMSAAAFYEDMPSVSIPDGPSSTNSTIIPWIEIGDAHIGMLAWESETGQNFDLKIAERELCTGIQMLIESLGCHERCVINDLGDATHYENFAGVTEGHGHSLDYDGRFSKMIPVYSRIMRFIIDCALRNFKYVDVIINQGNHSRTNDVWMAELIRVAYRDTDRVSVLKNDSVFIPYRMGNTFVMTHHSDKCKPAQLAKVMATDFPEDWGESKYRYIDIGHVHHNMVVKEHPGVSVESFNQLAAPDKYAHDGGWRSRQSITAIKRCKIYGEVGRERLPIEKIRDDIYNKFNIDNRYKRKEVYSV